MNTIATLVNGVDVEKLVSTVNAVAENTQLADFRFRAHTEWQGGARSRTTIDRFYGAGGEDSTRSEPFVLEGDEPGVLLGADSAPNAVEALLHALSSCLAVGFSYNAAARGIALESLAFDLEGELDLRGFLGISDAVRPGYSKINVTYHVKSDAPREKILELCDYVQKTSPVLDIIRNPVDVSVTLAD